MSSEISQAMSKLWSDPERRKTQSEKMKAKWASMSPEEKEARRKKQSDIMKERWGSKPDPAPTFDYTTHPDYEPGLPLQMQTASVLNYIQEKLDEQG